MRNRQIYWLTVIGSLAQSNLMDNFLIALGPHFFYVPSLIHMIVYSLEMLFLLEKIEQSYKQSLVNCSILCIKCSLYQIIRIHENMKIGKRNNDCHLPNLLWCKFIGKLAHVISWS